MDKYYEDGGDGFSHLSLVINLATSMSFQYEKMKTYYPAAIRYLLPNFYLFIY